MERALATKRKKVNLLVRNLDKTYLELVKRDDYTYARSEQTGELRTKHLRQLEQTTLIRFFKLP